MIADRERYAAVGREYRELERASGLAREWRTLNDDLEGARELLAEERRRGAAQGRRPMRRPGSRSSPRRSAWRWSSAIPTTTRTCWSRSGPVPAATRRRCSPATSTRCSPATPRSGASATEMISQSPAEVGGFKDVTFAIKGDGAYSVFKYEGGTHRVQRVPKTESQGRIHTSTATVAVLPEAEEVDVADRPERPPDRRLPLVGPGRAVGQHDRLGGADHPQAERDRRLDAGREVAAPEPRQGDAGAARAAAREGDRRPAGRDLGRAPLAGRDRRALGEGPHLQLPAGPRHRPPDQADEPRPRRGPRRATCASSATRSPPRRSAASSRRRPPSRG